MVSLLGFDGEASGAADNCISKILNLYKKSTRTYIPVGGLSRSGKSTFISFLQYRLKEKLISSISIPLDYWILPVSQRQDSMTVKDRYQYERISNDVSILIESGVISLFPYQSLTRTISQHPIRISIKEAQVVFFDGVIALDHQYLSQISSMKIYIEVEEEIRKKRFVEFYKKKQISDEAIRLLYENRIQDEADLVIASGKKADFIINLSPGKNQKILV